MSKSFNLTVFFLLVTQLLWAKVPSMESYNYNKCNNEVTFNMLYGVQKNVGGVCSNYEDEIRSGSIYLTVNGTQHQIARMTFSSSSSSIPSGYDKAFKSYGSNDNWVFFDEKFSWVNVSFHARNEHDDDCVAQDGDRYEHYVRVSIAIPEQYSGEGQTFTVKISGDWDGSTNFSDESGTETTPTIPRVANPLELTPECDGVLLKWGQPSFVCTNASYLVYRDGTLLNGSSPNNFNTLEYKDYSVAYDDDDDHVYEVKVRFNSRVYDYGLPTSVSGNPIKNFDSPDYFESVSLSVTSLCNQMVRLQWEVDDNVDIDFFEVERALNDNFDSPITYNISQKVGTISFDDNQLDFNTDYYYRIRVKDNCGNVTYTKASQTQHVMFEGPPSQPVVSQVNPATDGSDHATITWTYPEDGTPVDYFQVYRREQGASGSARSSKLDADVFSFDDDGLNNCFEYEYWVVAGKECFDDVSSMRIEKVISFNTDLNGFDDFSASKYYFNDRVSLEWEVSDGTEASEIVVYRKRAGSDDSPEIIKRLNIQSSSYDDYDTDPGVLYSYGILAISCPEYKPSRDEIDAMITDTGVYSETGIINGKITYEGGNAVEGVRVLATPSDGENRGVSLGMAGNQLVIPLEQDDENWFPEEWTLSFWFRLHDKSSSQMIMNIADGSDFLEIKPLGGETVSFDELEYTEETNVVGVSDELVGYMLPDGEIKSYTDQSTIARLDGTEFEEIKKVQIEGISSGDTLYDFVSKEPWLLKQASEWYQLQEQNTTIAVADSTIGILQGDTVYEAFDSDFVLAFIENDKLFQANHFNISYELSEPYAFMKDNEMIFANDPTITAEIIDDVVYSDGEPIHLIKGQNIFYVYYDHLTEKLVRGRRFARKVPNTTDPEVSFDVLMIKKSITEEIRKGTQLGIVSSDRTKVFETDSGLGLINYLIDQNGIFSTAVYQDATVFVPEPTPSYSVFGQSLMNSIGEVEYVFSAHEDSLYSVTLRQGTLDAMDFVKDADTGEYIYFLGEYVDGDRQVYSAAGDVVTEVVSQVVGTYTKEAYQAQVNVFGGSLSTSVDMVSPELYLGEFNNLMLAYDGNELIYFVNGNSIDTVAVSNLHNLFLQDDQQIVFGAYDGIQDETLLWSEAKDSLQVKKDFNRYLSGGEDHLIGYWRLDERVDTNAFDASYTLDNTGKKNFNGHHATLDVDNWSNVVPEQEDLSFTAFTDKDGNYSIQSIIYAGSGNNFKLVPTLGTHRFEPSNKVLFIGPGQQIQNEKDFMDRSAFRVTGTVKYDPKILGFDTSEDPSAPNCYVEGVKFYIDDQPVLTDGSFYATDKNGRFEFDVPIGSHSIRVEKDKHSFSIETWPPTGTYNFQGEINDLVFYDNTTRTLIGKVVGGSTEGEKISGEGTSINNIGKAEIKLKSIGKACYETIVETHPITGEFKVDLPPFRYNIVDLSVPSQSTDFNRKLRRLAEASIDLSKNSMSKDSVYCVENCQVANEKIYYHLVRDFVYREPAQINVFSATNSDRNYLGDVKYEEVFRGEDVNVAGLPYDVFTTNSVIIWDISITEDYYNLDDPADIIHYADTIRNENVIVDNDMTNQVTSHELSEGFVRYTFTPSESALLYDRVNPYDSFTKSIQVRTEDGQTWREKSDIYKGYVFGGAAESNHRSFYTVSNEGQEYQVVDFILRDPPGSQSYAGLAEKTKITKVRKSSYEGGFIHESALSFGAKNTFEGNTPVLSWETTDFKSYAGPRAKTTQTREAEEVSVHFFETDLEFETSKDNKNTGAGSDLFIGNAMNVFVSPLYVTRLVSLATCDSTNIECFTDISFTIEGDPYTIGRQRALGASLKEKETYFYYTQRQIEQLIEDLDRDAGLVDTTSVEGKVTASRLRNQSRIWKSAIGQNEYEKLIAKYNLDNEADPGLNAENISFGYGSNIDRKYTVGVNNSLSSKKAFSTYVGFEINLEFSFYGVYTHFNLKGGGSVFASEVEMAEEANQQEIHFSLKDDDPGDQYSVDVILNNYPTTLSEGNELANVYDTFKDGRLPNGFGQIDDVDTDSYYTPVDKTDYINPIFITRGGRTSCPHEPEEKAKYLSYMKYEWLQDLESKGIIDGFSLRADEPLAFDIHENSTQDYVLNYGTFQRDQPGFRIEPRVQTGIPWDGLKRATFDVFFENLNVEDTVRTYTLLVDQRTTGAGPTIRLDGERFIKGTDIALYGGEQLKKSITIRPVVDVYDYEDIVVYLVAGCQFDFGQDLDFQEDIFARDTLSVYFDPVCPLATSISPTENWIINNQTGPELPIEIQEVEYYFENHDKIKLQFKAAYQSDEDWVDVAVWSRDQDEIDAQVAIGEDYRLMPTEQNYIVYDWNTDDYNLPDGRYQIRWYYHCINGLESYSPLIGGEIDRTSPHAFGRPSPADGVLSPNDEIILTLNEPIESGLVDRDFISVRGKINGTELIHPVSVRFSDSQSDQILIPNIQLKQMPVTIEMWIKRDEAFASRPQEIFYHGEPGGTELKLELLAGGKLKLSLNNQELVSENPVPLDNWSHVAFSINPNENKAALYHNATLIGFDEAFVAMHYATGSLVVGGSGATSLTANVHELRLWNKYKTATDMAQNFYKDLIGREAGLLGYWPLNEGRGELAQDKVQGRQAQVNADWWALPASLSFDFDGSNNLELPSTAFLEDEDFTIEFWFKALVTSTDDSLTLMSSGQSEGLDWEITINIHGQLTLLHNERSFILSDQALLDERWHHFALVVNRVGQTRGYIDGEVTSTFAAELFEGFGGPKVVLGSRLSYTGLGNEVLSKHFVGQMDEFRIWRMAKRTEQIERMANHKLEGNEFGLVRYMPFEDYNDFLRVSEGSLACLDEYESGEMADSNHELFSVENPGITLKPYETPVYFNYSVSGDKIIITLDEENPATIENCILDISVRNLIDQNGNIMNSPVTWSVFVDRNQITWEERTINLQKEVNVPLEFRSKIVNGGGEMQNFTIDNLPTWLTAEPSSGSISPDSEQEIVFTVNSGLNIGQYEQPLHLRTDFGFNESLLLSLKVSQKLPADWTFVPEDFQYTMSFIGQVEIKGNYSVDDEDRVAVFVNDKMRGMAALQYQEVYDSYQVFLSAYSNSPSAGEVLEFRVWDASEGKVLTNIEIPEIDESPITFIQNEIYGTPSSPVTFLSENKVLFAMDIPKGWKWISFNLDSDDLDRTRNLFEGEALTDGDRFLSLEAVDIYDGENDLWIGNLAADNLPPSEGGLELSQAYRIYSSNPIQLQVSGKPVETTSHSIQLYSPASSIKPRMWNWIGFLGQENMEINEALASLHPSDGDIIKSQYAFAIYDPVLKWIGNLNFLSPGQGYMIQVAEDQLLTFPQTGLINGRTMASSVLDQYNQVNFDPHIYRENMNMVVQVVGLDVNKGAPVLEAYHNDELRGVSEVSTVDDEQLYYLTVYGDGEEELNYRIRFEGLAYPLHETHDFALASVLGSKQEPLIMSYIDNENINLGLQAFPNPFNNNVKFVFELDEQGFTELRVFSLDGKILLDREFIGNSHEVVEFDWDGTDDLGSELTPGTYLVKFHSADLDKGQLLIKQ